MVRAVGVSLVTLGNLSKARYLCIQTGAQDSKLTNLKKLKSEKIGRPFKVAVRLGECHTIRFLSRLGPKWKPLCKCLVSPASL